MASSNAVAIASRDMQYRNTLLFGTFLLFSTILLFPFRSGAQCLTPTPPIVSTSPNWNNFDVDGNMYSAEFGILHYFTGSKIQAYSSLVNVYTVGGDLVNVPDGQSFDGTEDISGAGEFTDLTVGDWQIIFKYLPDGRLGFLRFTVTNDGINTSPDSIEVTEIAFQDATDMDGIIAGDCASLNNTALPIELDFFRARALEAEIKLEWATVSEIDNLGFDIQRSTDGVLFNSIGWRAGQGDSNRRVNYSFLDKKLQDNITYYYRIVNRDRLGGGATSPVQTAQIKSDRFTMVSPAFPNPVIDGQTHVQIVSQKNTAVQMSLFNSQGLQLRREEVQIDKGANQLAIAVDQLPSGQYFILVQNDQDIARRSFLIQR